MTELYLIPVDYQTQTFRMCYLDDKRRYLGFPHYTLQGWFDHKAELECLWVDYFKGPISRNTFTKILSIEYPTVSKKVEAWIYISLNGFTPLNDKTTSRLIHSGLSAVEFTKDKYTVPLARTAVDYMTARL